MWHLLILSFLSSAACIVPSLSNTTGFKEPQLSLSAGGNALCISGHLPLLVKANYSLASYPQPSNQLEFTDYLTLFTTNTSLLSNVSTVIETRNVSQTLWGKLCFQANSTKRIRTVIFLTHGATLDHNYWDLAPGYSYVDSAAAAGYATFSYDRLGIGSSDHPDPQDVQGPVQVELAHAIVQKLRNSGLGNFWFENVVGVGHSAGCSLTIGISSKYPSDFDAVILTGFSRVAASFAPLISWDSIIANEDPSKRFLSLPNGYFTQGSKQALHYAFFKHPFFNPRLLDLSYEQRQTTTIAEFLTLGLVGRPSPAFSGPVQTILGRYDISICGGNCATPVDLSKTARPLFYPNANPNGSEDVLMEDAGHNLNAHLNRQETFDVMNAFLARNEF